MYFRGIAADSKFQEKMKGYLFSEGYLFTGVYGISAVNRPDSAAGFQFVIAIVVYGTDRLIVRAA